MAESDSPGVISAAEPVAKVAPVLLEEEAGFISPTAGDLPSMAGLHGLRISLEVSKSMEKGNLLGKMGITSQVAPTGL